MDSWRLMKFPGLRVTLCTCVLSLAPGCHDAWGHCPYAAGGHKSFRRDPRARVGGKVWLKSGPCGLAADESPRPSDPQGCCRDAFAAWPGSAASRHCSAIRVIQGRLGDCPLAAPTPVPQGMAFRTHICPQAGARSWGHRQEAGGRDPAQVTAQREAGGSDQWSLWGGEEGLTRQRLGKGPGWQAPGIPACRVPGQSLSSAGGGGAGRLRA